MAILDTDIIFRLSVKTGSAGDTTASSPAASLGKYVSTTAINLGTPLANLFDHVTGDEAVSGDTEYRCFFVLNNSAEEWTNVVAWLADQVSGGASVDFALDPAGNVAKGSSSAQAAEIATESNAPSGVTFTGSPPTTKGAGLSIGTLAAGFVRAIWMKRIVPAATGQQANDGFDIRVEGDDAP